ncbi:MAG: hypothetical protein ABI560_04040, partial [Myxococcales bacterium]
WCQRRHWHLLLLKASGQTHGGGAPWPADSAAYGRVLAWVSKGAHLDGASASESGAAAVATTAPGAGEARSSTATGGAVVRKHASERSNGALLEAPIPLREAPPPLAVPSPVSPAPAPVGSPPLTAGSTVSPVAAPAPASTFAGTVHPLMMASCATCHRAGAPAGGTRLVLSGAVERDEATARALLDASDAARSALVIKASGEMHGGGVVWPPSDPRQAILLAWAMHPAATSVDLPPAGREVASLPTPTTSAVGPGSSGGEAAVPPSPSPASHAAGGPAGLALPLGFFLNGRFDIDYERRQFTGNPFGSAGANALRSYHHFLFLSHASADDACGVSLEVLTLQFWEVHCRLLDRTRPVALVVAGGKLVVPFGADPLYHQSYGGLAGFDQRILPVLWAQEGVAGHLVYQRGPLVLSDDLFLVRGYGLGRADAVLSLQNDFSPADDAKLGWGNRLGAAWMGISAWYSSYFNTLGFGRHLFMQAVDLTVSRQRQLPVVGHFSLGAGLLRADISGGDGGAGGVGRDYYHFGSYLQLRYHPTDWAFLQYRQGLRTFNNRRGVILDRSRLTSADGSTHSFGVVGRHGGLTGGIFYFLNLEKVDEVPDDLFRVSLTYDF